MNFSLCVVFREWKEGINVDMEFRVFVKDNMINAITEYNHPFLVFELLDKKNCYFIKNQIFTYWSNNIKEKLEY
ncbi:hypothetical protein, partial [Listeria monocytogenes]|uniref:hypothetical protein n=1 Tax=Listeria monocytogenes TaxID=1639 RepID=UPI003C6D2934